MFAELSVKDLFFDSNHTWKLQRKLRKVQALDASYGEEIGECSVFSTEGVGR